MVSSLTTCSILQASSEAISLETPRRRKNSVKSVCLSYILIAIFSPSGRSVIYPSLEISIKFAFFKRPTALETLGFEYYGPIDGHDINALVNIFEIFPLSIKKCSEILLIVISSVKCSLTYFTIL